jgi:putative sporulation protein YtaF
VELAAMFLFALAVSADGFAAGVAYGINKIKIPMVSLIVIASASAFAVTVSMICGKGLLMIIPDYLSSSIGAFILIAIGLYFLLRAGQDKIKKIEVNGDEPLATLNLNSLGIIIQILKKPSTADFDHSGEISTKEAFFLGLALALDALGAGIGIAMAGFDILFTAISVGLLKFILINGGIFMGSIVKNGYIKTTSSVIPGIIFIAIGIFELI